MRGRHEERALGNERQAKDSRVVDVREEEHVVVVASAFEEEFEELRRVRALRVDERALVLERVSLAEGAALVQLEIPRARALDREASDGHAVHLIESRGEVALPREVVRRVRGRDLDREVRSEALHHGTCMGLGPAGYVAVPLHDDEQARTAQFATRSTSCSSRASNAGQVHSRSTYARPDSPSTSRLAMTPLSAAAKVMRS